MKRLLILALGWMIGGCASLHFTKIRHGRLEGRLIVEWIEPDRFIFRPDAENPLKFTRANSDVITPGTMTTDGGSIPRPLWPLRHYSPWGYAPAFIIHDWLFHRHRCEGNTDYDLHEAALVMSEVMKTMMLCRKDVFPEDRATVYLMYLAVQSPPARKSWDSMCDDKNNALWINKVPTASWTIEWPPHP